MTTHDLTLIGATGLPSDPTRQNHHLIGGASVAGAETFDRRSPAHGTLVSVNATGTAEDVDRAVKAARTAFASWSRSSGKDRATILLRTADLIDENRETLARLDVLESGKPISQALAEIEGAADIWRYAAALARTHSGESHNSLGGDMLGLVLKEPIGVVSLITPWNFPFLIASQKLPFALAAGCTAVLKPSEMTPSSTVMMGELLGQAGLPDGVVNIVLGFGDPVGAAMTSHPDVDMVSFTGSTGVGKAIESAAADTLKKVASELGGKNPQVIFADADLDSAIDAIVFGIYFNAGECCNSGSRIIVERSIADEVVARVTELSKKVAFGDPLDPATKVGAIISDQHMDKVSGFVARATAAGAKVALGGDEITVDGLPGRFYGPTVLTEVAPDMEIATAEVFGPVLSVLTFDSFDEAISLVNNASYGLSAGVWSENVHTCLAFARAVQTGTVWTNTFMDGFPELPFGGVKESGQGRELGRYGLEEYFETKTVQMRIGRTRGNWV